MADVRPMGGRARAAARLIAARTPSGRHCRPRSPPRTLRAGDPSSVSPRKQGEMTRMGEMAQDPASRRRAPLASGSVGEHLLRGAAGLVAAVLAIVLVTVVGPVSLVLLTVTVVAWRGCPTCWAVGLLGTIADERGSSSSQPRHPAPSPVRHISAARLVPPRSPGQCPSSTGRARRSCRRGL